MCIECSLLCILGPSITEVIYKCVYSFSIYFIFYEKFSGFRTLPDGITAIVLLQRLWEINEVRTESHEKIEFFLECSVSKNTTATIPGRAISLVANLKAHQWPQHSFWVIAILNGALISLAWPGLQGPAGKGHFPADLLASISSALNKWIILSPAPSWSSELNLLLCLRKKAVKGQENPTGAKGKKKSLWSQPQRHFLCTNALIFSVWTLNWKSQAPKYGSVLVFFHQNFS